MEGREEKGATFTKYQHFSFREGKKPPSRVARIAPSALTISRDIAFQHPL